MDGADPSTLLGLQVLVAEGLRWLTAAGLGMARPVGIVLILPVFTRAELGGLIRLVLALALAVPVLPYLQESVPPLQADVRVLQLTAVTLKELFIGLLIGFLLGLPLWAIQAVGELIDTQRGISSESAPVDPATRSQASALGLFLGILAITVFVAAGGLDTLVETLYRSYALWPVSAPLPKADAEAMMALAALVDRVVRSAVLIAGPVIVLMLLADLSVMLIGRFAPQLNAWDLAPTLKNVAAVLFLLAYAGYLFEYIGGEVGRSRGVAGQLELFLR